MMPTEAWALIRATLLSVNATQGKRDSIYSRLKGSENREAIRKSLRNDHMPTRKTLESLAGLVVALGLFKLYTPLDCLMKHRGIADWQSPKTITLSKTSGTLGRIQAQHAISLPQPFRLVRPYGIIDVGDHDCIVVGRLGFERDNDRPCGFIWDSREPDEFLILPESWLNSTNGNVTVGYSTTPEVISTYSRHSTTESSARFLLSSSASQIYLRFKGLHIRHLGLSGNSDQRRDWDISQTTDRPDSHKSSWLRHVSPAGVVCGYRSIGYQGSDKQCFAFAGEWGGFQELEPSQGFSFAKAHCVADPGLIAGYSLNGNMLRDQVATCWDLTSGVLRPFFTSTLPSGFHHCNSGGLCVGSCQRGGTEIGYMVDLKSGSDSLISNLASLSDFNASGMRFWGCNENGVTVGYVYDPVTNLEQEGRAVVAIFGGDTAYTLDHELEGESLDDQNGQTLGVIGRSVSLVYSESVSASGLIAVAGCSKIRSRDFLLIARIC